jgi:hypothetical protein
MRRSFGPPGRSMRIDMHVARMTIVAALGCAIASGACSTHPAPAANGVPVAPPIESAHDAAAPIATATPVPALSASASPEVDDAGALDAARAESRAKAASVTSASAGPVRVINIGMHIGGGPNDDVTKEPIHKSVAPHFEEIARCFPASAAPPVDFGVDLTIEAKGGKARVERPRTALRDDAFVACVVGVFEGAEFLAPRFGKTVVSYSLRFVPKTH